MKCDISQNKSNKIMKKYFVNILKQSNHQMQNKKKEQEK